MAQMKQWKVTSTAKGFDGLELTDAVVPELGENDVLVRIYAVSLNFRDLMIPKGDYPFPLELPVVPCSDGAGEVVSVGRKVTRWREGDKVITLLSQAHIYGPPNTATINSGLGGSLDGTLRQYGAFNEQGLVRMPANLTFREASTLPCAGVTAWNALYGLKPVKPGQTVLVLGSGGVSVFALQFAKAAGAKVIATTSSHAKAAMLKKLGADHIVNYVEDINWGETVRKLTTVGVDHVIEVGGAATLQQSMKAIKYEGVMSVIGAVAKGQAQIPSLLDAWINTFIARGVSVGSREMMEDMVAAVEAADIHPLVDERLISLGEARDAFHFFETGKNVGKIVIDVA